MSGAAPQIGAVALSPKVRLYLRSFKLCAVVALADGGVTTTRDPCRVIGKPLAIWWTTAVGALAIVKECRTTQCNDLQAIAAMLHVSLTAHDVVIVRAQRSIERMDALVEQARQNGGLLSFNRAYKWLRKHAKAEGRCAPPYGLALYRLKLELYKHAAGEVDPGMITRALGLDRADKQKQKA